MSARDDILLALMDACDRRKKLAEAATEGHATPSVSLADASAALSGYSRAISSTYHDNQVEQFVTRLTSVKGEALRVPDAAGAVQAITDVFKHWNVKGVALVNDRLVRELNVQPLVEGLKLPHIWLHGDPQEDAWRESLALAALERREPTVPWDVAVMGCDGAIAETGTTVHRTAPHRGRGGWLLCRAQLVLLDAGQLLPDLEDLFARGSALDKDDLPRAITCVTGPSRTADIEQTLTVGVHGPGRFCAIVIG